MDVKELKNEVERLKKELMDAKKEKKDKDVITFKVSPKKAVSVYGLQRFPVTLYASQWKILLEHSEKLIEFMDENADQLAVKE